MPKYCACITFVLLLFCMTGGSSQDKSFEVPDYSGEILFYRLKYGILNIGFASISCVSDSTNSEIKIRAEAKSSGWIRIFRDLDYRFECHMDQTTGFPNSAIRSLRDGRYKMYNELVFDHTSNIDSTIIYSQLSGQHVVPRNTYDILTGFYHFRKNYLFNSTTHSEDIVIPTYFTDELWDLRLRYSGEEIIKTKYGQFLCYKCNPVTVIGRFFKNDDDMSIWFTKDKISIPIKLKLNLRIGSIIGELDEYQNPNFKLIQPGLN